MSYNDVDQNCNKKCMRYCEPCFDKYRPQVCNVCESMIGPTDLAESRVRSIGEQAFRRITTNVVFTLQKMRAGQSLDGKVERRVACIDKHWDLNHD